MNPPTFRAQVPSGRPLDAAAPQEAVAAILERFFLAEQDDDRSLAKRTPDSIPEAVFANMSSRAKIAWLRSSAPPLPPGHDPGINLIQVGPRRMTRKGALCLALEHAVQERREDVPGICRQLTNEYRATDVTFPVLGVPFSRPRLRDWAREGLGPGMDVPHPTEIEHLGKALYNSNPQNVHEDNVIIALAAQLQEIDRRIPQHRRISQDDAEVEIRAYLALRIHDRAAVAGLDYANARTIAVPNFGQSVRGAIGVLWNYIRAVPDIEMQAQLKASMAVKLREISIERPCSVGLIERIIDIPTAIDWSITQKMSVQHLREELQRLAGATNEMCDADPDLAHQANSAVIEGGKDATDNLGAEITKLKRDRFLHTAEIEFSLFRRIDSQLVKTEAQRVFPENILI